MKLKTYGSGSEGNTHTLTSSTGETLVLDAGVRPTAVFRDCMPNSIAGVLITHSHGDHAAYARKYIDKFISVYAPYEAEGITKVESKQIINIGSFMVQVLSMHHDVPCVGFLIRHPEICGDILYATDTHHISWSFESLALAMVEADYSGKLLCQNVKDGVTPRTVAERTLKTHQGINGALRFLDHNVKNVYNAVFVHLSKDNAMKQLFLDMAKKCFDFPCYVAENGFELEISKYDLFK